MAINGLRLSGYALSVSAAAALLAGCGGPQPPVAAPGAIPPENETAVTGPAAKICGVQILHAFTGDHGYFPNGWGRVD